MANIIKLEDQMTILMDLMEIPKEKRSFLELKKRMEKIIKDNKHTDKLMTQNQSNNDNSQSMGKVSIMENILNNPGLFHLAKNIFQNLDCDD